MAAFQETLDLVVKDIDRSFATKRRKPTGETEIIETSFDHAFTALKLFELTGDSCYLQNWMGYALENAVHTDNGIQWNFSPNVTDIPPDADSTAMNLLFMTMAEKRGIVLPQDYYAPKNLSEFGELTDESGGVKTYFGIKPDNDVDPIINTAIAFLYELNHVSDNTKQGVRNYLRDQTKRLTKPSKVSEYYVGRAYFVARMAKLSTYDPKMLDEVAKNILSMYLREAKPVNALETALLSIAAAYHGLYEKAVELNGELERKRKANGLWHFGTFYRQRTPRFNYGHERLTTLFALEALKLEEQGFQAVKVEY